MAVSKAQNFQQEATVAAVCTQPVITIAQHRSMESAAQELFQKKISALIVVDEIDRCIGIVTASDIVRYLARQSDLSSDQWLASDIQVREAANGSIDVSRFPIESVVRHMTSAIQTVPADTPISHARQIMRKQRIHHLLLIDQSNRPAGILSSLDLL